MACGRGNGHVLRVGRPSNVAACDRRDHARRTYAGDHLPRRPRRDARLPRADGGTRRVRSPVRLLRPARQRPQRAPARRAVRRSGRPSCSSASSSRSPPTSAIDVGYHVVGQSWGGMLAMLHALEHPPGLRSITVCNSPSSMRLWVAEANRLRADLPPDVQATLLAARGRRDDGLARVQGGGARVLRAPRLPPPDRRVARVRARARSTRWTAIRPSTTR